MKYDEFIEAVSQRANISPDEAVVLTRATLETLSERISGSDARALAAHLPRALQAALLAAEEPAERFRVEARTMAEIANIREQLGEIVSEIGVPISGGGPVEDYLCCI